MYTTDSASGGLDGRRMAHPDGTPRVGPTFLAVFEQGQRGGQAVNSDPANLPNLASQDGCPELDMYTTDSASGGLDGR